MTNLQYYKRILAGIACATVLMSNLGGTSQVVFASEISEQASEGAAEEAATDQAPAEPASDDVRDTQSNEDPRTEPQESVPSIEEDGAAGDEESGMTQETETSTEDPEASDTTAGEQESDQEPENGGAAEEAEDAEEPEEIEEIDEDGSAEAEVIRYEAHTSGIKVKAEAKAGALPEDARLRAQLIQSERDLEEVSKELDNSDVEYDDYVALDVYFESEGREIEPDGTVSVTFELEDTVLPENVKADSVTVQHFDESKRTTDVVTVADTTESEETGTVEISSTETVETPKDQDDVEVVAADATVTAEFEVESFSTFTIVWTYTQYDGDGSTNKDYTGVNFSLNVTCVDENGDEISDVPDAVVDDKLELEYTRDWSKGNDKTIIDSGNVVTPTDDDLQIKGYTLKTITLYYQAYNWDKEMSHENVQKIVLDFQYGNYQAEITKLDTTTGETKTDILYPYQFSKTLRMVLTYSGGGGGGEEPTTGGALRVNGVLSDDSTRGFIPDGMTYDINLAFDAEQLVARAAYKAVIYNADGSKAKTKSLSLTDGKATVTLKEGQYFIIEGLPDGISYQVTETVPKGFSVTYKNASGTITEGETIEVTITNKYRVVKTGVDAGDLTARAAAASAVMMIIFGAAYMQMSRRYRYSKCSK